MTSSGLTSRMLANSSLFVIPLPSRRAANTRMRWRRSFRTFRFFSPAIMASTAWPMIPANASSTPSPVAALVSEVGAPGKFSFSQRILAARSWSPSCGRPC